MKKLLFLIVVLGGVGVWVAFTSYYTVKPGEKVVILQLGKYSRTVSTAGPLIHLPYPIESRDVVEGDRELRMQFGDIDDPDKRGETAIQTSDNNIVLVEAVVLYKRAKPFETLYRARDVRAMLREAAPAAIREVVGRNTVDGVLRQRRALVRSEMEARLQEIVGKYEMGLEITGVELQDVQAPDAVRASFDDVVNANQDQNRKVNDAEGYANEKVPTARAKAAELIAEAQAYKDATVAEATGEAERFTALLVEYQRAPEITRKRLYLETMEEVLPDVEKVIIEPGGTPILPYLPLGGAARAAAPGAGG